MSAWWEGLEQRVAAWLPAVQSQQHAGCYRLAREAFHPRSIDATSLALDLRLMLGQPAALPGALDFFDSCQDPVTGFYHEPHREELDASVPRIHEMSGTYFGYQVGAVLLALGRAPRHPFAFYEALRPSGRLERYMAENMPWDRAPMGAGNMCDHGATMMRANARFFDSAWSEMLQRMRDWLDAHQNPATGLWGSEAPQGKNGLVQAGYHLMRGLHFHDDAPPARCERITDTTLASLQECGVFQDGQGEGCHDMDHFVVLERMLRYTNGYREADIRAACERRLHQLRHLHREDGAFSFESRGSITNHNRHEVTAGLAQSDLVGTVFFMETLLRQLRVLGLPVAWRSSVTHGVPH
ncbi:hypothetical protein ACS5PK_08140 [Roseateles sp. DB2]|uniref:hypothetical protein n=1 Tax=Roseateles sp. DB2 TaxID=3453717 RepID=UPI003EEE0D7B